jgi:uncharacterized protein YkwD
MHLKSILTSLIILGFLAGCTFPGALPPFLGFLGAATPTPTDTAMVTLTATSTETRTFTPINSSAAFLSAVSPHEAIIPVGDNSHGHPSADTISRLLAAGARVWRTDQRGTIIVVSDGIAYTIKPSDGWKIYLPLVIKSTPPPSTQTPTPTATSTPTPTRTFTPVSTGCTLTHNGAFEQQLYVLINNERANAGLAPLTPNNALEISAGYHSDDMAVNHFMSHIGSDGSTFWERAVRAGYTGHWGGEIIMGGSSPESAVTWWMNDAPHRAMILGDLNDFGAGYAHCSGNYFTVDFGHR